MEKTEYRSTIGEKKNIGSTFDSWLREEGIYEEVSAAAIRRKSEELREMAEKMARAARAGVAIEKKRLEEILAERQKKSGQAPEVAP